MCKKIITCIISVVLCSCLFAEGEFNLLGKKNIFRLNTVLDSVLLGTGAVIYGTDVILDKGMDIGQPEYKGEVFNLEKLNGFDRMLAHKYDRTIDKISDVLFVSSFALPAVFAAEDKSEWLTVAAMYAETLLISQGIKEGIKIGVFRPRPYMYFEGMPYKDVYEERDWANSFVSGHSTMSFAAATFTTYTFSKYFPEGPWKYVVGAGSYALAGTIAATRILAGCHFPTDVLSGIVLGTGIGFLVPWLHTLNIEKGETRTEIGLIPNGMLLTVKF